MASSGVVSTVVEAPPSGAAMHCRQSRGTQIGDMPLSMPANSPKTERSLNCLDP